MPKKRKIRQSSEYINISSLVHNYKEECICYVNGLCVCRKTQRNSPNEELGAIEEEVSNIANIKMSQLLDSLSNRRH